MYYLPIWLEFLIYGTIVFFAIVMVKYCFDLIKIVREK
jgi:hypothetical protein